MAFESVASNLVPDDTNAAPDIFLHDRQAGTTVRVSVSSSGAQANSSSAYPEISADGRFITFESVASNLVPGDTNGADAAYAGKDVFVHDRSTGETSRLSVSSSGAQGDDKSYRPYISGDGRFVIFGSEATNLVAGDVNGEEDVFIHDRRDGSTALASLTADGGLSRDISISAGSYPEDISQDGQHIVFTSGANDMPCGNNGVDNVYVRDRLAGTTTVASPCGANNSSFDASITASGGFIAFVSRASNLVGVDTNDDSRGAGLSGRDIFVVDRATGGIARVSVSSSGAEASEASNSDSPTISRFGRYVVFASSADNLVTGDLNGVGDVFMHDRQTGATTRVSLSSQGVEANGWSGGSYSLAMSGNARFSAFHSDASNLVSGDTNSTADIFSHDYGATDDATISIPAVPVGQTFGLSSGLHAANPTICRGDPVNTATGAFVYEIVDLALPGSGKTFDLRRSYTSVDTTSGVLGMGWTHSLELGLNVLADRIVLKGESGEEVAFPVNPDGSIAKPPGARSALTVVSGGYELLRRDQVRYSFNGSGHLTSIIDRNGVGLTIARDTGGRVATVTDSVGRAATFTYGETGNLISVALADGRSVHYGYTSGQLTSVKDVRGGIVTYSYDADGRLTKVVDQGGNASVTNVYGADGRVVKQIDASGRETLFGWDASLQTATTTDPDGNQWRDTYHDNVLVEAVDPLGNTTTFGYDKELNLTAVTDPAGSITRYEYDGRGNVLKRLAPAPLWYEDAYTYDSANNLTSHTDDKGRKTLFQYDPRGNLVTVTAPDNTTTQFGYDDVGKVTSITDPRGKITSFAHDSKGNVAAITTPAGSRTTLEYDARAHLRKIVEPRGNVAGAIPDDFDTTFTYDEAGHRLTSTNPLGNETAWAYDAVGNVVTARDAKGRATTFGYDAMNRLTTVTSPDQTQTKYSYDGRSNVIERTDANNHITTYSYDAASRMTKLIRPGGKTWTYAYDPNGNVSTIVDANGNATTDAFDGTTVFKYDDINRLIKVDYSDSTPDVSYAYDALNNRTSMTDGSGTETYAYDTLGRLTAVTRGTMTFGYGYDAASNVIQRRYPDGSIVDFTYDDDNRLATVARDLATTSYGYDAAGNHTGTTFPGGNGHVEARQYDAAGHLTDIRTDKGTTNLNRFSYTYDAVGNPLGVTGTQGTVTYAYDASDRLTEACFAALCPGGSDPYIRYTYDSVGNRLTEARPAGTTTYEYSAADELLSQSGATTATFTHDANGNMTASGAKTYTYDLANRMKTAEVGTTTTSYSYDGDGNRLQAGTGTRAQEITKWQWDVNNFLPELAIERDGRDTVLRRYTHGLDLLSMSSGTAEYFFHSDALGSVTNVTNASGSPQWSYSYEPFGATRSETKHNTKAPANPMRFTGEYADATGLTHLRARQYDPTLGRFTATDPLAPAVADPYVSAYVYVGNQPTVYVDPSGEIAIVLAVPALIVVAAALTAAQHPEVASEVASDLAYDVEEFFGGTAAAPSLGEVVPCDGWAVSGSTVYTRDIERNPGPDALNEVVAKQQRPVGDGGNQFGRKPPWCASAACRAAVAAAAAAYGVYELRPTGRQN